MVPDRIENEILLDAPLEELQRYVQQEVVAAARRRVRATAISSGLPLPTHASDGSTRCSRRRRDGNHARR